MPRVRVSPKKTLAGIFFPRYSAFLDKLNWNARWLDTVRHAAGVPQFQCRRDLHSFISETRLHGGTDLVDYLEFGVYHGESLRLWAELNKNPSSRMFGFDSFEGLPEDWNPKHPKGTFSTRGNLPEIKDSRVVLVAGWFQQSLREFLSSYEPSHKLVIHNDCDLFSSTLYCLTVLDSVIRPGTIIIFDEFDAVLDEYRALTSYASAFIRTYEIIAATTGFCQTAVEID
jgi:O-methyltransferase